MTKNWGPLNLPFVTFFCHFPLSKYPSVSLGFTLWPSVRFWYPPSPCIPLLPLRARPSHSICWYPLVAPCFIFTICMHSIPSYSCFEYITKLINSYSLQALFFIAHSWLLALLIYLSSIADIDMTYSFGNLLTSISDWALFILHWDLVMMIPFLRFPLIECI